MDPEASLSEFSSPRANLPSMATMGEFGSPPQGSTLAPGVALSSQQEQDCSPLPQSYAMCVIPDAPPLPLPLPGLTSTTSPDAQARGCPIVVSRLSYSVTCPALPRKQSDEGSMRGKDALQGMVGGSAQEPQESSAPCFSPVRLTGCLRGNWCAAPKLSFRVSPAEDIGGATAVGPTDSVSTIGLPLTRQCTSLLPMRASKTLLSDISFTAAPGEVLAVVGSSGAGKSTLLDALAGRISPASLQGSILVSGVSPASRNLKRLLGYVAQDEALFPMLTPRETLMLSACLRLPLSVSHKDKAKRVEDLLNDLGLQAVADTHIGDAEKRGISGGEKRRVSIGTDLVHDPPVLLLDEPTSGLDSHAALNTLQVLRTMALQHQRTVVLSIHQPSCRILEQIDKFLVLAGGRVAFFGRLEGLEVRLGHVGLPVPIRMNGLEYCIELLQSNTQATESLIEAAAQDSLVIIKAQSCLALPAPDSLDAGGERGQEGAGEKQRKYATTSWNEVWNLCSRNVKVMFRTKELCLVRAAQVALCALGLGTVFLHIPSTTEGITERMGFLAFSLAFLLTSSMEALPLFLKERQVFVRETARGAYRLSSYQLASILVFLPFLLVLALLFSLGSYWLVGLYPAVDTFLFFVLVVWSALVVANSMVAFFAALFPDFITANSLIAGLMGGYFLFSGYFISKKNIPPYWIWMYHLSIFKYPMEALLVNEYGSQPDTQFGFLTGEQVLETLDLSTTNKWVQVLALLGFSVLYRVLCYGALLLHGTTRR